MRKMFWMFAVMVGVAYALDPGDFVPDERKAKPRASVPVHALVKSMPSVQRVDVQAKLHQVKTALHFYMEENNELPANAEGLRPLTKTGYLDPGDIVDPWGREFSYRAEKVKEHAFMEEFEVFVSSSGPDRIPDTADDIHLD